MSNVLRVQRKEMIMGPTIWEFTPMELIVSHAGTVALTILVVVPLMMILHHMMKKPYGDRKEDGMRPYQIEEYRKRLHGSTITPRQK